MTSRLPHRRPCATLPLTFALLLALGACRKPDAGGAPAGAPGEMPPTPVETAVAQSQLVVDVFRAVGSVEAREFVRVASEIDGRVAALPFEEGRHVQAGQVLARLDDVQARAELERAEALLAHARLEADRASSLAAERIVPAQSRDEKLADLRVAEADAALQRARLDKTTIRAPFAGVVGSRHVSPGAHVRAGDALTDLAAIDTVKIAFSAPERLLGSLQPGERVKVSTPAHPGASFDGEVSVVDPIVDAGTRSARVVAITTNPERLLKPGMSATVDVLFAQRPDAITIPNEAVFVEGDASLVYVVEADGSVRRQQVELGTRTAQAVEVLSGLSAGDRVVRAGHQKLWPGAKVQPVDASASAGAAGP